MNLPLLLDFFSRNDRFLIASHHEPDADGIGSEVALAYGLRNLGKKVRVLNADKAASAFLFFDWENLIESLEESAPLRPDLGEWNLVILDTSDLDHVGRIRNDVVPHVKSVTMVDHHTAVKRPERAWIDEEAAAASQMVFEILEAWKTPLTPEVAAALFAGLVFDTGSFIYPKTSPRTFEVAQKLTQAGAKPKDVHAQLFETIEPQRMRLTGKIQGTLELSFHDAIALQWMTLEMLREAGATAEDAENLVNYPLKCHTVQVSLLLKETGADGFRCSIRSKGAIDVSRPAILHGGGGHRNAAGFPCPPGPLEAAKHFVLELAESLFPKDPR